jgi:hypothetical protein
MKITRILNSVFVWAMIAIAITAMFYSYISNAITNNVVGAAMAISYTAVAIYIIRKGDDIMMMMKKAWEWLCNDHNPVFKLFISVVYISAFGGWMVTTMNRVIGSESATIQDLLLLVVGTVLTLGAMARVGVSLIDIATQPAHAPRHPLPWMKYGSWGWWVIVLVIVGCSGGGEPVQGWTAHPDDRTYGHRLQVAKWEVGKLTSLEQIFPDHAAYDVERVMGGCPIVTGCSKTKHHYSPAIYPAPCAREVEDGVFRITESACRACAILNVFHHPNGWVRNWDPLKESGIIGLNDPLSTMLIVGLLIGLLFTSNKLIHTKGGNKMKNLFKELRERFTRMRQMWHLVGQAGGLYRYNKICPMCTKHAQEPTSVITMLSAALSRGHCDRKEALAHQAELIDQGISYPVCLDCGQKVALTLCDQSYREENGFDQELMLEQYKGKCWRYGLKLSVKELFQSRSLYYPEA